MEFNKSMDWLKESDEENLLADDDLDMVDEGLYVDPANYDKHDDLVDVVDKAGNPQKMTQATYDKNKGSGEFTVKEPEKNTQKFNRDSAIAYINDITQDVEDDGVTLKDDYYDRVLDYSGDLRNPENWPTKVNDIFSHQYKIRHKLYDQFRDYAITDDGRKEQEKYKQQYDDVYDDATKALKNVDKNERFDIIDSYYKNADYADDQSGSKTAKVQHILQSFDYDVRNKNDMRKAYKELKSKLNR